MKKISIVGVGMGPDSLTREAQDAIRAADVLLGAPRCLAMLVCENKPAFPEYLPDAVKRIVSESRAASFAVLVSGDVGFFSASDALVHALSAYDIRLIPGISSLSCFFARLKLSWQEAALVSCHGREGRLVDTVRRNRLTFVLTGGNIQELAARLIAAGYGKLPAHTGENLGTDTERILSMPVSALADAQIGPLAVLLIENPEFDACVRFGIADDEFLRGDVPMTKSEVRAVAMSKLSLFPDAVCCDIGCGTGSVSVEMALSAYKGRVYSIDRNAEALRLTTENAKRFHIGNLTAILGEAPEALRELPPFDAVFIGGSGGNMSAIFDAVLMKNPHTRIVINAIALESVNAAITAFHAHGMEAELLQLAVSRAKHIGELHLMTAQNPVFILSGGGHE